MDKKILKTKNTILLLTCSLSIIFLLRLPVYANDFDWSSGNWGIKVTNFGAVESKISNVTYPGGNKTGRALEVYYRVSDIDIPQFWVFLTDGFWRQASYGNSFGTSYRLFRYYSSTNENCDKVTASIFSVVGVTSDNKLKINLTYENSVLEGDRFQIAATVYLLPPSRTITSMNTTITVTNISGYTVIPYWDGHRILAEQWELFGISSMYVADNLSGGLPSWYNTLDPNNDYVGITDDDDYLNDGFSINGQINVSTHDVKTIAFREQIIELDHDSCPYINVPGYWYQELVLLDQVADNVQIKHLYELGRRHHIKLMSCDGITTKTQNLKWAATYNRNDTNMVDGDNIQIKLGLDDFLNKWPIGAYQSISLELRTGSHQISDAIEVLRLLSGVSASPEVIGCIQDVDSNGRIDLPEAIHILQLVAGVR